MKSFQQIFTDSSLWKLLRLSSPEFSQISVSTLISSQFPASEDTTEAVQHQFLTLKQKWIQFIKFNINLPKFHRNRFEDAYKYPHTTYTFSLKISMMKKKKKYKDFTFMESDPMITKKNGGFDNVAGKS